MCVCAYARVCACMHVCVCASMCVCETDNHGSGGFRGVSVVSIETPFGLC